MCLVMTKPVDILAVRHVKQGIEAGGSRTGHPSNYYLLLSNPNTSTIYSVQFINPSMRNALFMLSEHFVEIVKSLSMTSATSTHGCCIH